MALTFVALGAQFFLAYKNEKARTMILMSSIIFAGFAIAELRTIISYTEMLRTPQYLKNETGIVRSFSRRKVGASVIIKHEKSSIKLYSTKRLVELRPGDIVNFSAYIEPSRGSLTPSGYDFAMFQYFNGIRATGRLIGEIKVVKRTEHYSIFPRIREIIYEKFKYYLPEVPSEIALALTIGKKDGMDSKTTEIFRKSGTSHLLAISGLHMGLVSLFFFSVVRRCFALSEHLALRYDIKKLSVLTGVAASIFYLQLSGMQISAQRACIMTCTFFLSILIDRKPDILRSITFAAVTLITLYPENIFRPGFQMSFFAVLGICSYKRKDPLSASIPPQRHELQALKQLAQPQTSKRENLYTNANKALRKVLSTLYYFEKMPHEGSFRRIAIIWKKIFRCFIHLVRMTRTSILATAATTPFVLYHFHYFSAIGIISNAVAIPLTSFFIVPTITGILLLMPLYDSLALYNLLSLEIRLLIKLMESFNQLSAAYIEVHGFSGKTLLLLVTGTLLLLIGKTGQKYIGVAFLAVGTIMVLLSPLPDIFISEKNIALRSQDGNLYFLNAKRTPKNLNARKWLQYSGCKTAMTSTSPKAEIDKKGHSYTYTKDKKVVAIDLTKTTAENTDYDLVITANSLLPKKEAAIPLEGENSFIFVGKRGITIKRARNWSLSITTQRPSLPH